MIKKIQMRFEGTNWKDEEMILVGAIDHLKEIVYKVGELSASTMKSKISSEKKRQPSQNTLENNIKVYRPTKGKYKFSVGVGKISLLDKAAPYWKDIDVGGVIPMSEVGFFAGDHAPDSNLAGTGVGTEIFIKDPSGYKIVPKNPIPGFHYISYGIHVGESNYYRLLDKWEKKWSSDSKSKKETKILT